MKIHLSFKTDSQYHDSPKRPPDVKAHRIQPEESSQEKEMRHDRWNIKRQVYIYIQIQILNKKDVKIKVNNIDIFF